MSRLFVLGNAGVDLCLPVPRLPLPGETLVGGALSRAPGGKGLNQAVVAARLGLVPVCLMAPLGADAEGEFVAAVLAAEPFAGLELPRIGAATDVSILLVSPDGENSIVTAGGCADALPAGLAAGFAASCGVDDVLLLQGNLSQAATLAALLACRGRAVLNTAPLRWDPAGMLPHCAFVVANAREAEAITGRSGAAAARALLQAGAARALVTLGGEGCVVAGPEGLTRHPAVPVAAIDTTGAGDTVCGVLAAGLAAGWGFARIVRAAQRAAAMTVTRHGAFAALPDGAALRRALTHEDWSEMEGQGPCA